MHINNYIISKPIGEHEIQINSNVYTVLFDQYNSLGFHYTTSYNQPHYFQDDTDIEKFKFSLQQTLHQSFTAFLLDTSGSLAVEHAIHYSQLCTGKSRALKYRGCYHGSTSALKDLDNDPLSLPHSTEDALINAPPFTYEQSICEITDRLATSQYSCIVIDPNFCDYFIKVPNWYWMQLRSLCDRFGVFLVFDEMRSGFRCDQIWFVNQLAIHVDIVVGAKALSNGLPFSFTAIHERIYNSDLTDEVNKRCTGFSYNPFIISNSCSVLKTLCTLHSTSSNISTIFKHAAAVHANASIRFHPRGCSLIITIITDKPVLIAALCEARLKSEGILVYRSENKFILYPHFNMPVDRLKIILFKFIDIINAVLTSGLTRPPGSITDLVPLNTEYCINDFEKTEDTHS